MSSSSASRDHIALSRVVDVVEGAAAGSLREDAGRAAEAGALRTAALSKLSSRPIAASAKACAAPSTGPTDSTAQPPHHRRGKPPGKRAVPASRCESNSRVGWRMARRLFKASCSL